jgi:hypothetical protein
MSKIETKWGIGTLEYFRKLNKPGCEGEYVRAITDFVYKDCTLRDGDNYQDLIEDLISKTKTQVQLDNEWSDTEKIQMIESVLDIAPLHEVSAYTLKSVIMDIIKLDR